MKTIAIQGIRGAFHEEAAYQWQGNEALEIAACSTFKDVVASTLSGETDLGIMAIENTISGTIHQNLALLTHNPVHICGEVHLRIKQQLGALKGSQINQLSEARSHYMALNQCQAFFDNHKHIKLVESEDTAYSVREVAEQQLSTVGAVGSQRAMEHYNLEIIAPDIETNKENFTRFFIIKKGSFSAFQFDKVTVSLILPHENGSLHNVLGIFKDLGIGLTKIESIPILGQPYQYQFIMDLMIQDITQFNEAQTQLSKACEHVQVLGCYKSHTLN